MVWSSSKFILYFFKLSNPKHSLKFNMIKLLKFQHMFCDWRVLNLSLFVIVVIKFIIWDKNDISFINGQWRGSFLCMLLFVAFFLCLLWLLFGRFWNFLTFRLLKFKNYLWVKQLHLLELVVLWQVLGLKLRLKALIQLLIRDFKLLIMFLLNFP